MHKWIHIISYPTVIILLYFHTAVSGHSSLYYTVPPFIFYLVDSLFRTYRFALPTISAAERFGTVTILTVKLNYQPKIAPGQWYNIFLVSRVESHPLSVVDVTLDLDGGSTLIFAAGSRKTSLPKKLLKSKINVKLDGPYGNSFEGIYKNNIVVLFAGGIGITPLLYILKHGVTNYKSTKFRLVVSTNDMNIVKAFEKSLLEVKKLGVEIVVNLTSLRKVEDEQIDLAEEAFLIPVVKSGRPNLKKIILTLKNEYPKENISIGCCGPPKFCNNILNDSRNLSDKSCLVQVFSESFSY
ncbi:Dual oxidase 1 [Clydaea vesicula]|uniref:Dual oxidase 1 n=1 Tax=Clydaea vesicula TaxID=447962 RepID=A0AAD5U036_9FUNG|nr:Dual oxidase 1 [Clydaea vesicula]